jgi:hypothetical protein
LGIILHSPAIFEEAIESHSSVDPRAVGVATGLIGLSIVENKIPTIPPSLQTKFYHSVIASAR